MFNNLLIIILIIILFLIGYFLYQLAINNWDISKITWKVDDIQKIESIKDPCVFLENDIISNNVLDKDGKQVTVNKKIECNKCGDYIYKGPGGCSPYQQDAFYTMTDRVSGNEVGVCTAISFPRPCDPKSPPQTQ